MDTSLEFIEMCKKFHEQSEIEYETPSIGIGGSPRLWWCNGNPFWFDGEDLIRLFTQYQLQEMVELESTNLIKMEMFFDFYVRENRGEYLSETAEIRDPSYEELWLKFVMKEKYSKEWDGKEWVKK